jgi:hypothetical protein
LKRLQSRDNPQFKRIAALSSSARDRREQGRILLDGHHLIHAYLANFGPRDVCLLLRDDCVDRPESLALRARVDEGATLQLADRLFDAISPVDAPSGVMATVPLPVLATPQLEHRGFTVLLDGIQDPGTSVRSFAVRLPRDAVRRIFHPHVPIHGPRDVCAAAWGRIFSWQCTTGSRCRRWRASSTVGSSLRRLGGVRPVRCIIDWCGCLRHRRGREGHIARSTPLCGHATAHTDGEWHRIAECRVCCYLAVL